MAIQIKDNVNSPRVQHFSAEENNFPASQTQTLVDGHPFRPYKVFNGALVPDSLWSIKELSIEAKAIYARLLSYCRDKDSCNPRLSVLADAVGLSEDRTGRALKELMSGGFIHRMRRGTGRSTATQLLWNSRLSSSLKPGFDTAPVRCQDEVLIPQNHRPDTAPVRCLDTAPLRSVYREEEVQFEEVQEVSTTTTNGTVSISHPKQPGGWWTDEQLSEARGILLCSVPSLRKPDSAITGRILIGLSGWTDFELYANCLTGMRMKAKSWGLIEKDVRDYWPQRLADHLADTAEAERKEQARTDLAAEPQTEQYATGKPQTWIERMDAKLIQQDEAEQRERIAKQKAEQEPVAITQPIATIVKTITPLEAEKRRQEDEHFDRVQASILDAQRRKKSLQPVRNPLLGSMAGLQHTSVLLSQMVSA